MVNRKTRLTLELLKKEAAGCQRCDLWRHATQTVFGEGAPTAALVLVGEQPGDEEDRQGRPFVGPAGRLLDRALEQAGLPRSDLYLTNVVKHFKWQLRGKRRIHSKPQLLEIAACHGWLDAEIATLKPRAILCLGATAAQTLLGASFRVTRDRGTFVESPLAPLVMATVHPSSILRARTDEERHTAMRLFVRDLKRLAARLSEH